MAIRVPDLGGLSMCAEFGATATVSRLILIFAEVLRGGSQRSVTAAVKVRGEDLLMKIHGEINIPSWAMTIDPAR